MATRFQATPSVENCSQHYTTLTLEQVKHGSRASDTAWLRSMNYAFTKTGSKTFNRCYVKDRIRKDIFTVSHFACNVTYTIDGFVEKNKDRLPDTMVRKATGTIVYYCVLLCCGTFLFVGNGFFFLTMGNNDHFVIGHSFLTMTSFF
jgi:hypothetical protein